MAREGGPLIVAFGCRQVKSLGRQSKDGPWTDTAVEPGTRILGDIQPSACSVTPRREIQRCGLPTLPRAPRALPRLYKCGLRSADHNALHDSLLQTGLRFDATYSQRQCRSTTGPGTTRGSIHCRTNGMELRY